MSGAPHGISFLRPAIRRNVPFCQPAAGADEQQTGDKTSSLAPLQLATRAAPNYPDRFNLTARNFIKGPSGLRL